MMLDYIAPTRIYRRLTGHIEELVNYSKFRKIIAELSSQGKLDEIGLKVDSNLNMYIGIDLNPELLLYSETSKETVELKMISEKMLKYTDYLTKQGIIDFIKVDYDRVKNDTFYGYVIQIGFNFTKYTKAKFAYSIGFFLFIISVLSTLIVSAL